MFVVDCAYVYLWEEVQDVDCAEELDGEVLRGICFGSSSEYCDRGLGLRVEFGGGVLGWIGLGSVGWRWCWCWAFLRHG